MPLPFWGNEKLLHFATTLQTYLNSGMTLRLFKNNFVPDPSTPLSSFIEATFPGYAAIPLTGLFGAPTLVQNGQYQLATGMLTFAATSGSNTVYGWYISDGTNVQAAQLLDSPFIISPGTSYVLILRPQEISQSILP